MFTDVVNTTVSNRRKTNFWTMGIYGPLPPSPAHDSVMLSPDNDWLDALSCLCCDVRVLTCLCCDVRVLTCLFSSSAASRHVDGGKSKHITPTQNTNVLSIVTKLWLLLSDLIVKWPTHIWSFMGVGFPPTRICEFLCHMRIPLPVKRWVIIMEAKCLSVTGRDCKFWKRCWT